jgi:hypothetical protein
MVHTHERRLVHGWWWPVRPKLVFVHMAESVPEIMNCSLYIYWQYPSLLQLYQNSLPPRSIFEITSRLTFCLKYIWECLNAHILSEIFLRSRLSLKCLWVASKLTFYLKYLFGCIWSHILSEISFRLHLKSYSVWNIFEVVSKLTFCLKYLWGSI